MRTGGNNFLGTQQVRSSCLKFFLLTITVVRPTFSLVTRDERQYIYKRYFVQFWGVKEGVTMRFKTQFQSQGPLLLNIPHGYGLERAPYLLAVAPTSVFLIHNVTPPCAGWKSWTLSLPSTECQERGRRH